MGGSDGVICSLHEAGWHTFMLHSRKLNMIKSCSSNEQVFGFYQGGER